ncbi:hypothetical protein [Dyella acidiphila]|uniref:Uncharacterized protein n=1 Tax=Dyella acidiphila TaxID=2775866 RepID=A0ABR9GBX5_9GAMM|nr:hypothetical protein [Dyella acidiphila]MBE1161553.1 hypothetical protein [Dyella acidiphila]
MKRKQVFGLSCIVAGGLAIAALYHRDRTFLHHKTRKCMQAPGQLKAAHSFTRSSSLLAWSVLADSAMEHYRGSFTNPAMTLPLASSLCALMAGIHSSGDSRPRRHVVRHAIYWSAAGIGIAGTAFHCYNIGKRPGGWCWNNLFYAAPIGAPMALLLSGVFGDVAERMREKPAVQPRLLGLPAWQSTALLCAAGLLGTAGEVGLLHLRGSFQHRAMYAPVLLAPAAATLLIHAAAVRRKPHWAARIALLAAQWLGVIGVLFHARGVARSQGGWRNWSQNLLSGPPLPAPPSLTALAMAGIAALRLEKAES